MPVTEQIGDIFESFEKGEVNVIIHQANCFHTMGGGIAKIIAQKYPCAKQVDDATLRGDKEKLGSFSIAHLPDGRKIINVYSQHDTSAMLNTEDDIKDPIEEHMADTGRATRYDAVVAGFQRIEQIISSAKNPEKYIVGIPYGYGSDLAGGSWTIVRAIIESVFGKSIAKVIVVRLPNKPNLS